MGRTLAGRVGEERKQTWIVYNNITENEVVLCCCFQNTVHNEKKKKMRKSLFPKKEARSGPQMPQHTELETPARFRDILERRKTLAHQEGALQNRINIVARSCKPIASRFAS